jgi:hypothetical protein
VADTHVPVAPVALTVMNNIDTVGFAIVIVLLVWLFVLQW